MPDKQIGLKIRSMIIEKEFSWREVRNHLLDFFKWVLWLKI